MIGNKAPDMKKLVIIWYCRSQRFSFKIKTDSKIAVQRGTTILLSVYAFIIRYHLFLECPVEYGLSV